MYVEAKIERALERPHALGYAKLARDAVESLDIGHLNELHVMATEVRGDTIAVEFSDGSKLGEDEAKSLVAEIQNAIIEAGGKP